MTAVCPCCGAEQTQSLLCHTCTTRLERDLGDVASIVGELDTTMSKQAKIGAGSGTAGLARERMPIGLGAMEAADNLANVLTTWARDVYPGGESIATAPSPRTNLAATRPGAFALGRPSVRAAAMLLSHIDAIRRHLAVNELCDEISDAVGQARRVVDRPADRIYLGQCYVEAPGEDGEKVTCFAELWARPDASEVRCRVCSTEHPVLERRVWLMQRAKDMIVTVKEASSYLGEIGGIPVTEASIRGLLHRGKRLSYRAPVDAKRFRLGDLLDVLMDDQERKSA